MSKREVEAPKTAALRLFCVRNEKTREIVKDGGSIRYFSSKKEAKASRDYLADITGGDYTFAVVLGPDHSRYQKGMQ
jgi:hypothetical protein